MKQAVQRSSARGQKGIPHSLFWAAGRLRDRPLRVVPEGRSRCTPCGQTSTLVSPSVETYGRIGVKVWVYRGEILPERRLKQNWRRPPRPFDRAGGPPSEPAPVSGGATEPIALWSSDQSPTPGCNQETSDDGA